MLFDYLPTYQFIGTTEMTHFKASCLHYLTNGVSRQKGFYSQLREITYDVLRALCTGVLSIFVFVSLRLMIPCSLFVSFLSDCFLTFCGKASQSNFCSLLSFLVMTEVFPTVCSPTTNLEASADTADSLSFVPRVLILLQHISKHNQLTDLKKKIGSNFSQRICVMASVCYCELKFNTYSMAFRDLELNGMCKITVTLSLATRERKAFVSALTM